MTSQPPQWWTDALALVVYGIRQRTIAKDDDADKWDAPGIKAQIARLADTCSPADLARVMCAGADNPTMKTPGGISEPGPQWAGTTQAGHKQRPRCGTHHVLLQAGDCPKCAEGLTKNRPANFQDIFQRAREQERAHREQERQEATRHE